MASSGCLQLKPSLTQPGKIIQLECFILFDLLFLAFKVQTDLQGTIFQKYWNFLTVFAERTQNDIFLLFTNTWKPYHLLLCNQVPLNINLILRTKQVYITIIGSRYSFFKSEAVSESR